MAMAATTIGVSWIQANSVLVGVHPLVAQRWFPVFIDWSVCESNSPTLQSQTRHQLPCISITHFRYSGVDRQVVQLRSNHYDLAPSPEFDTQWPPEDPEALHQHSESAFNNLSLSAVQEIEGILCSLQVATGPGCQCVFTAHEGFVRCDVERFG